MTSPTPSPPVIPSMPAAAATPPAAKPEIFIFLYVLCIISGIILVSIGFSISVMAMTAFHHFYNVIIGLTGALTTSWVGIWAVFQGVQGLRKMFKRANKTL